MNNSGFIVYYWLYNKFVVQMHFLYNVLSQIHYTSKSPVRHFLSKKVVKWCELTIDIFIKNG